MSRAQLAIAFAGHTVEWARSELELTTEEIGQAVGANRKTVQRWQEGESVPSPEHRKHLESLSQIRYLLKHSFRSGTAAQQWMQTPSEALKGKTPLFCLTEGDLDAVLKLLGSLAAGAFR